MNTIIKLLLSVAFWSTLASLFGVLNSIEAIQAVSPVAGAIIAGVATFTAAVARGLRDVLKPEE